MAHHRDICTWHNESESTDNACVFCVSRTECGTHNCCAAAAAASVRGRVCVCARSVSPIRFHTLPRSVLRVFCVLRCAAHADEAEPRPHTHAAPTQTHTTHTVTHRHTQTHSALCRCWMNVLHANTVPHTQNVAVREMRTCRRWTRGSMHVCVCVCMYICIYICVCVYVCVCIAHSSRRSVCKWRSTGMPLFIASSASVRGQKTRSHTTLSQLMRRSRRRVKGGRKRGRCWNTQVARITTPLHIHSEDSAEEKKRSHTQHTAENATLGKTGDALDENILSRTTHRETRRCTNSTHWRESNSLGREISALTQKQKAAVARVSALWETMKEHNKIRSEHTDTIAATETTISLSEKNRTKSWTSSSSCWTTRSLS